MNAIKALSITIDENNLIDTSALSDCSCNKLADNSAAFKLTHAAQIETIAIVNLSNDAGKARWVNLNNRWYPVGLGSFKLNHARGQGINITVNDKAIEPIDAEHLTEYTIDHIETVGLLTCATNDCIVIWINGVKYIIC